MKNYCLIVVWCICQPVFGQFDKEDVFPDLEGTELIQAVIETYKATSVLDYGEARDLLYGDIDLVNDTLSCVYTGLQVYINPNEDPSTAAFAQNINTEHTFPRSKGAQEFTFGYSDMHHLFPSRVDVNTARGVLPFSEINDNVTDRWYREDMTRTSKPSSNIDEFSEYKQNIAFEPREDHKGNVARAYFYFYTMYKFEADLADPNYFESQRETLCDWHFADPVDEIEWNRSKNIAAEQGNENPFVLDCSLVRIYCDDIAAACITVSDENVVGNSISMINDNNLLKISNPHSSIDFQIYSVTGKLLISESLRSGQSVLDISHLSSGLYFTAISKSGKILSTTKLVK